MSPITQLIIVCICLNLSATKIYKPTWKSLDSRPIPDWFNDAKFGIFIHWGVFSVPSFSSEWFWHQWRADKTPSVVQFMEENYKPGFTYADFAKQLTAEFYDANRWADLFQASGARYVVLTTKHHEGFTMWPSNISFNWNSMDCGPNRDIVGEFETAIRTRTNLTFGLYHSLFEWFNPLYLRDKANNFLTRDFVEAKAIPGLMEIVNKYHPWDIRGDGDWEAPDTYWGSKEFLVWLYNESPVKDVVAVSDAWGKNISCHHGGYFTCGDKFNPGILQKHKFENAMTIDRDSWGYRRNMQLSDILPMEEIIATFIQTVSCNGNMLMNVGPTKDGSISPIFEERLRQMGDWLSVNGEAIYASKPWTYQNDSFTSGVWYTVQPGPIVYATVLKWPTDSLTLRDPVASDAATVSLLGYPDYLFDWIHAYPSGITISIPMIPFNKMPCKWAWVFRLDGILN